MTSSNGNIFRVIGPLWGESTGDWWIPLTQASGAELWCFLYLHLNKRLSEKSRCWWFETPLRSLWRHCNKTQALEGFHMIWTGYYNLKIKYLALMLTVFHEKDFVILMVPTKFRRFNGSTSRCRLLWHSVVDNVDCVIAWLRVVPFI